MLRNELASVVKTKDSLKFWYEFRRTVTVCLKVSRERVLLLSKLFNSIRIGPGIAFGFWIPGKVRQSMLSVRWCYGMPKSDLHSQKFTLCS